MFPNFPHILCFSEHHLKKFELDQINVDGYSLGAANCRQVVKRGGVCIFVHKNLNYTTIGLGKYCKDQDIEVCAFQSFSACVMATSGATTLILTCFLMD